MLENVFQWVVAFAVFWVVCGLVDFLLVTMLFVRPRDIVKHWRCVFSPWIIGGRIKTGFLGFFETALSAPLIVFVRIFMPDQAPGYVNFDTVADEVLDA